FAVAIEQSQGSTFRREQLGGSPPDPGGGAGDQDPAAFEAISHLLLCYSVLCYSAAARSTTAGAAGVCQDCITGRTSLAKSRIECSATGKGMPPKRNDVASSKAPTTPRRSSSMRGMRSGGPHTAAFIKPSVMPSSPVFRT